MAVPEPAPQPDLSRLAEELSQWLAIQRTSGHFRWPRTHDPEDGPR